MVPCRFNGLHQGTEYLLEPAAINAGDLPVRAICCLMRPMASVVPVRMVNSGDREEEIHSGKVVGVACAEFNMSLQGKTSKTTDSEKVTGFRVDKHLRPNM